MITLESLNRKYELLANWEERFRTELTQYIDDTLAFCGGSLYLPLLYKNVDDANEEGEDFFQQFPASVSVQDNHGSIHDIQISALYKKDNLCQVEGYDRTDGCWVTGWPTLDDNSTYTALAYFINEVLNTEAEEDTATAPQTESSYKPVVIGYRILDEYDFVPDMFGQWDLFRTSDDAEAYMKTNLSNGYRVVEEWSHRQTRLSMYTFHGPDGKILED